MIIFRFELTETARRFLDERTSGHRGGFGRGGAGIAGDCDVAAVCRSTAGRPAANHRGDWDIAAGQFFTAFRRDVHVVEDFDDTRAVEWFAALDYGFAHYTVCLLGCRDGDGNKFIVDEHAERLWLRLMCNLQI